MEDIDELDVSHIEPASLADGLETTVNFERSGAEPERVLSGVLRRLARQGCGAHWKLSNVGAGPTLVG